MKKIFYGGPIITMDDNNPRVEAVVIDGNRIQALGAYDEMLKLVGPEDERVDLQGKVMMPGLIEPHIHLDHGGLLFNWVDISGFTNRTKEEVMKRITDAVAATPKGEWVTCFGYDYALVPDLESFTKKDLDKITTDHPLLVLIQSMHTMFVNSKALEVMNITKDTPDPAGGYYDRDENGEPNGIAIEIAAIIPFAFKWLQCVDYSLYDLMVQQLDEYRKIGVTTVWSGGLINYFKDYVDVNKKMIEDPKCPVRMSYSIPYEQIKNGEIDMTHPAEDSDRFQYTGLKIWYDGSPYSGTMFLEENYLNSPLMQDKFQVKKDQAGMSIYPKEKFRDIIEKYHKMGIQIAVHTQGDRSTREVLDCFEDVLTKYPRADHRHRLEHCALISDADYERASRLGITISYHINHIYYYGEVLHNDIIGPERANRLMAAKTALKNNIKFTLHTDPPMYRPNPLHVAATAVLRKTRDGLVLGADEAVTPHEALKAITIDSAWQLFREKDLGSIEVGKYADFTLLGQDPYETDPEQWKDIEIITTYLDGVDTNTL